MGEEDVNIIQAPESEPDPKDYERAIKELRQFTATFDPSSIENFTDLSVKCSTLGENLALITRARGKTNDDETYSVQFQNEKPGLLKPASESKVVFDPQKRSVKFTKSPSTLRENRKGYLPSNTWEVLIPTDAGEYSLEGEAAFSGFGTWGEDGRGWVNLWEYYEYPDVLQNYAEKLKEAASKTLSWSLRNDPAVHHEAEEIVEEKFNK